MPRPRLFTEAARVNVILEKTLHDAAKNKAREYQLRGGFSEYVGRLIKADLDRKGRRVLAATRFA